MIYIQTKLLMTKELIRNCRLLVVNELRCQMEVVNKQHYLNSVYEDKIEISTQKDYIEKETMWIATQRLTCDNAQRIRFDIINTFLTIKSGGNASNHKDSFSFDSVLSDEIIYVRTVLSNVIKH